MTTDPDELLSRPSPQAVDVLREIEGDIVVMGAGGKMGPTLARMARRASEEGGVRRRVIAVSRFPRDELRRRLEAWGVETVRCDLLDRHAVDQLPPAPNVLFLAGRKFGSTGRESLTWAMNTLVPGNVCERYRSSRIVAFSTGNTYGLCPARRGGSRETDPPRPEGDYAMSCLGRERVFEHYAETLKIPVVIFRLNYACELRYGVLVDLGRKVWNGEPVDLSMGYFNAIWQADANDIALRTLAHVSVPPFVLNVTGPELLRVRDVCEDFGRRLGREVKLRGVESPDAFLSSSARAQDLFGPPRVTADEMVARVADWIARGGPFLDKPTHFEVRDGDF